jgi:PPM family protein phosphatase
MRRSARGVVVDFAELSDPGRDPTKQINEDASAYAETVHGHLAVVCDGMGGHAGGRQASEAAIAAILEQTHQADPDQPPSRVLESAIQVAARAVYAVGGGAPQELRPGSTCVALLVHERGAEVGHVGDSRAYLVRAGAIQRLTRDHSMVQQMVDAGVLKPEDAPHHPEANKITRALGMAPEADVEIAREPVPLLAGDTLLLMTDGLTDLVSDPEVLDVVQQRIANGPAFVCRELVALSNERGGHDNITIQVLHVIEAPVMPPRAPDPTYVDIDASPGRAGSSGTLPGATIADDRPAKTLPGAARQPPAPTLLDDGYVERTTQPGDAPKLARGPVTFAHDAEPGPIKTRQARTLVLVGGAAAVVIVIGVAAWWIIASLRTPASEEPPPPEPTAARTIPIAPATSIQPEPEARDAGARPDAASPGDAGARDAAIGDARVAPKTP